MFLAPQIACSGCHFLGILSWCSNIPLGTPAWVTQYFSKTNNSLTLLGPVFPAPQLACSGSCHAVFQFWFGCPMFCKAPLCKNHRALVPAGYKLRVKANLGLVNAHILQARPLNLTWFLDCLTLVVHPIFLSTSSKELLLLLAITCGLQALGSGKVREIPFSMWS